VALLAAALNAPFGCGEAAVESRHDHDHGRHHHHHHRHHHHDEDQTKGEAAGAALRETEHHRRPATEPARHATVKARLKSTDKHEVPRPRVAAPKQKAPQPQHLAARPAVVASDAEILNRLKAVEQVLVSKEKATAMTRGQVEVNGPLPADFPERFSQGVASATGCAPDGIRVLGAKPSRDDDGNDMDEVVFEARGECVEAVRRQASDATSPLANGPLRVFLVARNTDGDDASADSAADQVPMVTAAPAAPAGKAHGAPEIDSSEMPYGDLEPFGREDTAQELTQSSIRESDAMVDQLERAEVAEEKRAVFRALTRLRGAAITSFDGIARSQTGSIDEYARKHSWRGLHPVRHLASEEADTSRWAFPVRAS